VKCTCLDFQLSTHSAGSFSGKCLRRGYLIFVNVYAAEPEHANTRGKEMKKLTLGALDLFQQTVDLYVKGNPRQNMCLVEVHF
jgi:hypothetical protein